MNEIAMITMIDPIAMINPRYFARETVSTKTILYWFDLCDAFWKYDYSSSRPGYHAELKSGLHSDSFLHAPEVLKHLNLRRILAKQLFLHWPEIAPAPDYVVGIPKGATELGQEVAECFKADYALLKKHEDGSMELVDEIPSAKRCLVVEDICTKGTGFKQGISAIKKRCLDISLMPFELVIINRGGLKEIKVEGIGYPFEILALVDYKINEWRVKDCLLCKRGSIPIKPKATPENWEILKNAQKEN